MQQPEQAPVVKQAVDQGDASPISVMSEGQENFYHALETALGLTEPPPAATPSVNP